MEVVSFVKVLIGVQEYGKRESLVSVWVFDMPRNQYNYPQTTRRINWIVARFQYFNPTKSVCTHYCFYDKKTGIDLSYKSAFVKLASAKGQVTKIENAIKAAKAAFAPTLFVKQLEDTDEYKRAIEKLNNAKAKVFEYKTLLDEELQQLNSSN